ncbi:MAG: zinc ABC transporter substrate-binding protein [Alphaproteobacteria bacterium]|nr:zinc ABC transporter substrate-binding protein [Alphaproteobacteria bacterium]
MSRWTLIWARIFVALVAASMVSPPLRADDGLRVVASVAPVHSLVAGVMAGVGEPVLILRGYGSPHGYQMRPSEARALAAASVVFWIGESLETFLVKPLGTLAGDATVISLIETEGLALLPARAGGVWDDRHDHEGAGDRAADLARTDPHVWLAPANARRMVAAIARALSAADPDRTAVYAANRDAWDARIADLDERLDAALAPVRAVPYVVFHDAFHYFEDRYGLRALGAVTVSPDRRPGPRRLTALRDRIQTLRARCAFTEPQFESPLIETIIEGTGAALGVVDPLGAAIAPGPNAYFEMMEANARALVTCLARAQRSE